MSAHARAWLRLSAVPGLAGTDASRALARLGGPEAFAGATPGALRAAGLGEETVARLVADEPPWLAPSLDWLEAAGHDLLAWDDPDYPGLLRAAPDAPLVLFLDGDRDVLALPHFAIVGSRNPTPQGAENARAFARHLAGYGLVICSGLATGIDAAAHAGALDAGMPTTAVLGCGPDRMYPEANAKLAQFIRRDGLVVSEHPPGTPPRRENFPRRNRIISGLSLAVLVVEAAKRSGSLITARLAGEQGREVYAIPGSIHNPLSRGCHQLIRQGATLVETAADIFAELGPLVGIAAGRTPEAAPARPLQEEPEAPDEDYVKLLESLGHDPADIDTLAARTGLTAGELSSMLLIMELQGLVESVPGGRFVRVSKRS